MNNNLHYHYANETPPVHVFVFMSKHEVCEKDQVIGGHLDPELVP